MSADSAVLQLATDSLAVATGVSGAFCLLTLVFARRLSGQLGGTARWVRLAIMGALETGYCALMIPYLRVNDPAESLFWIQLISVFMPFMTWLFVELTIDIAGLRDHWMRIFSRVALAFTCLFSVLLIVDMVAGTRLIFTAADTHPGTLHRKFAQATPLAKAYLSFVVFAFYVSAYFLYRHWRNVDRALAPLMVGCCLYFLSITNDFGILFGTHDAPFMQHFGFLSLYIGFTLFHGLEQMGVMERLHEADAEVRKHRGQMIENEKLRALGMASAFVTHEMNNVLTLLSFSASLDRRESSTPSATGTESLSDTDLAVRQLSGLVRSLQTFSRDARDDKPELTKVHRVVSEAARIARARAKTRGVDVHIDIEGELWISCRPARMVQALLNLINNGCDAAAELRDSRGEAWVRVQAAATSDGVAIAVTDSGPGIPPEAREQILEPFFTTKAAGEGTGLGLAVVRDIATSHGGRLEIDLDSEQTRFVILLPAVSASCDDGDQPSSATA